MEGRIACLVEVAGVVSKVWGKICLIRVLVYWYITIRYPEVS